jgi:hypothetical protein
VRFGDLDSVLRFSKIRSCDHELLAANIQCTLKDIFKVIFMSLSAMILSSKNRISEVDADLSLSDEIVTFRQVSRPNINVF